jgi:hypothetical protein
MTMSTPLAALACAGSLLAAGPLALADAATGTPSGGITQFFSSSVSGARAPITFTGAIGDYGKAISQDKNGKIDPNGAYEKMVLQHGTFIVDASALPQAFQHAKPQFNQTNCSFLLKVTGPGKISSGTGAYAGISGTISVDFTIAGIATRKGSTCELKHGGPTYGSYSTVTGNGRVSFS